MRPPSRICRLSTNPSPASQQLLLRQPAPFEDHFARRAGPHPQLVLLLARAEPRRPLLHQKRRNPVLRRPPVRHRHRHAHIRVMRIGGERLGPVQHPHPILLHRRGARPRSVRPRFRLRQRPAPEPLPRRQLRHVPPLLLLATHFVDVVRTQRRVRRQNDPYRPVYPRQFLDQNRVLDVPQPRAAQFFREDGAHVAQLPRACGSLPAGKSAPRPTP